MKKTGVGFVKQVGFKMGVKEEREFMDEQSGESEEESDGWRNRWVGNWKTGTRMRLTKR